MNKRVFSLLLILVLSAAPLSGCGDPEVGTGPSEAPTQGTVSPAPGGSTSEPASDPTSSPTSEPASEPTSSPTSEPASDPTSDPTSEPASDPTSDPTSEPASDPTSSPTSEPASEPTSNPTSEPTSDPTSNPTPTPTPVSERYNTVTVSGKDYRIGMTEAELHRLAGEPTEIVDSTRGFKWQCYYDGSYRAVLIAGVNNGTVIGLTAAGVDSSYCGIKVGTPGNVRAGGYEYDIGEIMAYVMYDKRDNYNLHAVQLLLMGYPASPTEGFLYGESRIAFHLTNAFRVLHGLHTLEWSDTAAQVARDYSKWMADDNFMGHFGPDGTSDPADRLEAAGIDWSEVAENLDGGATDGADAYSDWVSEPGHRANLLHEWVTHLGVGGYYRPSGSAYRFYWAQEFYELHNSYDW